LTHIKVTEEPSQPKSPEAQEKEKAGAGKEEKRIWRPGFRKKKKEAKENYDRYLRLSAELENYKKRTEKEKTETYKFANENILKDLLPVLDNLERALEHGREAGNPKSLLDGVELTHKSLWGGHGKIRNNRIEAMGEEFDPNHHEAVMVQEDAQKPPAWSSRSCKSDTGCIIAWSARPWWWYPKNRN